MYVRITYKRVIVKTIMCNKLDVKVILNNNILKTIQLQSKWLLLKCSFKWSLPYEYNVNNTTLAEKSRKVVFRVCRECFWSFWFPSGRTGRTLPPAEDQETVCPAGSPSTVRSLKTRDWNGSDGVLLSICLARIFSSFGVIETLTVQNVRRRITEAN